jgi:AcrR family transcriptional regulator
MDDIAATGHGPDDTIAVRDRIVAAAAALLAEGGREALTTRAVAVQAGVQAPTIYRLFGDKEGLLDAVAEHGFAAYLKEKRPADPGVDPVESLRAGWDLHIGFGLANPAIFAIMYGDPRPGKSSPAADKAYAMLQQRMRTLAAAGRLRVSEAQAVNVARAAGCGMVFTLLAMPETERDPDLSAVMREAMIDAITVAAPADEAPGVASTAITLRALLPEADGLTDGERVLLAEWLDRLSTPPKRR